MALDQARLIDALLRLARSEGVDALNMRRVAAELSVSPRLLYSFVKDKEEMLALLGDEILRRNMPDLAAPDWRARLRGIASNVRGTLAGYPGLPAAILSRSLVHVGSKDARAIRAAIFDAFALAGLSPQKAEQAYVAFTSLVLGGMVMAEAIGSGDNTIVTRASVESSVEAGVELLLLSVGDARQPADRRAP